MHIIIAVSAVCLSSCRNVSMTIKLLLVLPKVLSRMSQRKGRILSFVVVVVMVVMIMILAEG